MLLHPHAFPIAFDSYMFDDLQVFHSGGARELFVAGPPRRHGPGAD